MPHTRTPFDELEQEDTSAFSFAFRWFRVNRAAQQDSAFISPNPLQELEHLKTEEAVRRVEQLFDGGICR